MRRFLLLTLCAAFASTAASAQQYPNQPIRFVNGFAAGGATDVTFRTLSEELRTILGQAVVNENKPGANGLIAMEEVSKAKPDGYTFLILNSSGSSAMLLMKDKTNLEIDKKFVVVSPATVGPPTVIAAVKELPAATFPELVSYAKANPGKVRYASSGAQTGPHLDMVVLSKRAGVDMVHLPQKGAGGILTALSNRDGHIGMITMATIAGQVKGGDLKVLATANPTRLKNLPDVPTLTELGYPGVGNLLWHALYAPIGTPPEVLDTMFNAIQKGLQSDRMKDLYERTELAPKVLKTRAEAEEWAKTNLDDFKKVIAEVGADAK